METPRLAHSALRPGGRLLEARRLGGTRRIAVLLQAAALLAHLERAGQRLTGRWEGARIDSRGVVRGLSSASGRPEDLPHRRLFELLSTLFFEPGKGQAWSAARELRRSWGQGLVRIPADEAVGDILRQAPFLWASSHAPARGSLVAELRCEAASRVLLAGPARWRRQLRESASRDHESLRRLIRSDRALSCWLEAESARPADDGAEARAPAAGRGDRTGRELPPGSLSTRRRLQPGEAAWRWRELGWARRRTEDLWGAERAFRHAERLWRSCGDWAARGHALLDLAETRLCRGFPAGVSESLAEPAKGGAEGSGWDLRLRCVSARHELVTGRPGAALDHLPADSVSPGRWRSRRRCAIAADRRPVARPAASAADILAGRSHGWLGSAEAARRRLRGDSALVREVLESEEIPALWALAGDRERARRSAASVGPTAALWRARLDRRSGTAEEWRALESIEPYRAGRTVYDMERVEPGLTPHPWRLRAINALRRVGADRQARELEAGAVGPWEPVRLYLADRSASIDRLRLLLRDSGYAEVELAWHGPQGERLLIAGGGGDSALSAPLHGGRLVLRAGRFDPVLRTLFVLALRDLESLGRSVCSGDAGDRELPDLSDGGMIGRSAALRAAVSRLDRLASAPIPILIEGASGTGKELAARRVHATSPRRERAFVAINCAALPPNLVSSDLFGHARGAFTGADRERCGVFEAARAGTVFLDEIGDLPLNAQGMLLRVLQESEVRRLGESRARKVDVRVVAATHRDLERMTEQGTFRLDLFFRLAAGRVELPPLARRGDDVLLLAEHFLARDARVAGREPGVERAVPKLSRQARNRLRAHSWPGNVRELENVMAVAAALSGGERIRAEHLEIPRAPRSSRSGGAGEAAPLGYHGQLRALRSNLVQEALASSQGNRARAARRLGLSRQALAYLIRRLEIA